MMTRLLSSLDKKYMKKGECEAGAAGSHLTTKSREEEPNMDRMEPRNAGRGNGAGSVI
jgi:hypothetical protein